MESTLMVIAKLVRMAGGDQLHTGTAAGKMEKAASEVIKINDSLRMARPEDCVPSSFRWYSPRNCLSNIKNLSNDVVINAGGGIHGYPEGMRAGATAMRQAIDAFMNNVPLEDYAKTHKELQLALEEWGYRYLTEE
jgi:ribulose-bisphosphate carboxylase large chain